MDVARVAVLVILAGGALADIAVAAGMILVGALAHAISRPAEPKSLAIFVLIAAGFAAPPIALSLWRQNSYLYAFIAVCTPVTLVAIAAMLGI